MLFSAIVINIVFNTLIKFLAKVKAGKRGLTSPIKSPAG